MPIFDHFHSKISATIFNFLEFSEAGRKSIDSIHSFLRYSQFLSHMIRLATPIFNHAHPPTPRKIDQPLIYVNLYQHVKNQVISLIFSGDMVD